MRINYEKVISQAAQLENLGEELERVVSELKSFMDEVPSAWKGDASRAYLNECEFLKTKMSDTSRKIKKTSRDIRNVARKIHDEDDKIAQAAKRLKS